MTKKKKNIEDPQENPLNEALAEIESVQEAPATEEEKKEEGPTLQDIETLKNELEQTKAKAEEYLAGWQRALADFANYKKRIEREQALVNQNAVANVIKHYLEISDDLERALRALPKEGEIAGWSNGIELVYRKFLSYLEAEGVKTIPAEGQHFDPNLHEAISQEDSPDHQSGEIIGVVQQGYQLGDRVLRPARVRVAR